MLQEVPLLLQPRQLQVPIHEQDQERRAEMLVVAVEPQMEVYIDEGQTYNQRSEYVPV